MERPIRATLFNRQHEAVWTRAYARIENAMRRATEELMLNGEPGYVIEFSYEPTGRQLGWMKLHVNNKLSAWWIWE